MTYFQEDFVPNTSIHSHQKMRSLSLIPSCGAKTFLLCRDYGFLKQVIFKY